jgi:predicted lysophospholipase L1 biosynthesis ABC-type transport system permease subunit
MLFPLLGAIVGAVVGAAVGAVIAFGAAAGTVVAFGAAAGTVVAFGAAAAILVGVAVGVLPLLAFVVVPPHAANINERPMANRHNQVFVVLIIKYFCIGLLLCS